MRSVKNLIGLLKGQLFKYSMGLICATMINLFHVFTATVFMVLFDGVVERNTELVINSLIGFAAITVIMTLAIFVGYLLIRASTIRSISKLRGKAFDKMLSLPQQEYSKTHTGDFVSRVTNDIQTLERALTDQLVRLNSHFIAGLACMIYMFFINWKFALGLMAWNFFLT